MKSIFSLFKPIFIKVYGFWLLSKSRIKQQIALKRDKFGLILGNREVIHVALGIVALLVSSTNVLQAKDTQANYGAKTLLAQIVENAESEEIVESGLPSAHTAYHYLENEPVYKATLAMKEDTETAEALTTASGSLVKTNVLGTENGARGEVVEYTVQGGDTVSTIAERYGVSTNTVLWANDITSSSYVKPGQILKIPPTSGVLYTVKSGDTLDSIVKKYSADLNTVLEYNKLADASAISEGQTIILPNGAVPAPVYTAPRLASFGSVFSGQAPTGASPTGSWNWPTTTHRISQYYGGFHKGVDFDGEFGDPIYASRGGVVVQAGWNGGYGISVQIDHGGGYYTLYGHMEKLYVSYGQTVSQGQTLGLMGSTGYSSGPHLHFEVRVGSNSYLNTYNPFSYL